MMFNITSCNIKNEIDNKTMTLNVEWSEDDVKILIMRHGEIPVRGQIATAKLVEAAENFNRTEAEYLDDTKQELCGKNSEIQFFFKENLFTWKRKIWTRGKIMCRPVIEIIELSNLFVDIIGKNLISHEIVLNMEKQNRKLKKKIERMEKSMERMEKIKNTIEDELYKRFLILLNSKKNRIRALRDQLREYKKDEIYDKSTDESDVEATDFEDSQLSKRSKIDTKSNECDESKGGLPIFNNITRAIENADDSDESFELKFEDSQPYSQNHLNIVDEDPEEDIFSS